MPGVCGRTTVRSPAGSVAATRDELEVQGILVVQDVQLVGAVDDRVVDRVLDALAARPDDPRLGAQVVGGHEPHLAT